MIRLLLGWLALGIAALPSAAAEPWKRHAVDNTSRGADGVRLADANHDGLPDIATGWEEGGVVRVYLHPGHENVREPWPLRTVGRVKSPEDAVLFAPRGNGRFAVLSSCEGGTRSHFLHEPPASGDPWAEGAAWSTTAIPATAGKMWMFALPLPTPNEPARVIVGSKGADAEVGLLEFVAEPGDREAWNYRPLARAGWIMSLAPFDFNADGRTDVLVSDRKGSTRGIFWLEQPAEPTGEWPRHELGLAGREVMFLDVADLDADGRPDIAAAAKGPEALVLLRQPENISDEWTSREIPLPPGYGGAKAVAIGDLDHDGRPDLAFTCEGASGELRGAGWLRAPANPWSGAWEPHDISGPEGVKFDRIELLDLDADGDLDLLTCEERDNLGVIWYENPAK